MYSQYLEKLLERHDLTAREAETLMTDTMQGNLNEAQIAAWLVALRAKGESYTEIAAFASVMRKFAVEPPGLQRPVLDTCGTGGDASGLMNVSTLAALALAAHGIPVAKHGNRAVSSASGSADLLEKLGYRLDETPEQTAQRINIDHFGFMFAPIYHPAMKHAIGPRKSLKIRTVFNILGPLSSPASAELHMLGVYSPEMASVMASALQQLAIKAALVVSSEDGLDEISPVEKTHYHFIHDNSIESGVIDPAQFGLSIKSLDELKVSDADEALEKAQKVIAGEYQPGIEMVALNACAAAYLTAVIEGDKRPVNEYISDNLSEWISMIRQKELQKVLDSWQRDP